MANRKKSWFKKNKKWPSFLEERRAYIEALPCAREIHDLRTKYGKSDLKVYHCELKKILGALPQDLFLITWEAAIYGDYGQCLSPKEERAYRGAAAKRIRPLLRKLRGKPAFLKELVRNEYYYHSFLYLQQHRLGIELLERGYNGHFSAGVGAAMHAWELCLRGKRALAIDFGQRALAHWETFSDPVEAGSTFYCLSLAFSGQPEKARKAYERVRRQDKHPRHQPYYESRAKHLEFAIQFMAKQD